MTFRTECEAAAWDGARGVWAVALRDLATGARFVHECRLLFAAVGVLVEPREPPLAGRARFAGPVVHTARWRDDVDLRDKHVVVLGNGCERALCSGRHAPLVCDSHFAQARRARRCRGSRRWPRRSRSSSAGRTGSSSARTSTTGPRCGGRSAIFRSLRAWCVCGYLWPWRRTTGGCFLAAKRARGPGAPRRRKRGAIFCAWRLRSTMIC